VRALTLRLGAEMLVLGRQAGSVAEGERRLAAAIADGSGLERFRALVRAQGGDPGLLEKPSALLGPLENTEVRAARAGWLVGEDGLAVGLAAVVLGAGRMRADATIDPGVGFTVRHHLGEQVERGESLVSVHHRAGQDVSEVCARLGEAFRIGDAAEPEPPLLVERMEARPS
jgi:thymidine phosphorylase